MKGIVHGKKKENILGNSNATNIGSTQASSLAPGSASIGGAKALAPLTQVKDKFAVKKSEFPSFKTGGSLPCLDDELPGSEFPGAGIGKQKN